MNNDRTINFGKYKGTPIKKLIIEHIGYIYWCLSNIKWFKLNADEQELYDVLAIAKIKSERDFIFPLQELAKYIVDKNKYSKMDTPFIISKNGIIKYKDKNNPIVCSVLKYKDNLKPFTTSQMICTAKYLFEPIDDFWDDNPLNDSYFFMGENPHTILE